MGDGMTEVLFRRLHKFAKEPLRANPDDAGFDLYSLKFHRSEPGEVTEIPTGISIQLKPFHCALVLPRSGLARKHQLTVQNSPGLIDSGYRGEIVVLLRNEGKEVYNVKPGERIAQLLVVGLPAVKMTEVAELETSSRGTSGFGSSGK